MRDKACGHDSYLGHLGLFLFVLLVLLAIGELFSLFGSGLFIQPVIGIAIGSVTAFFLVVGSRVRSCRCVRPAGFEPTPEDAQAKAKVAAALAHLPPAFRSFNHLVFNNLGIDHVVLSTQGCVLIHTRRFSERLEGNSEGLGIGGKDAGFLIAECWHQVHSLQEGIQRRFGRDVDIYPVLCLPHLSIQTPASVKGVAVTNLELLPEVIQAYSAETMDKDFLFILSGFLVSLA